MNQIERLCNTLADEGYSPHIYNEHELCQMLWLMEYDPYYYDDINKLLERYDNVMLFEVDSFEELAMSFVEEGLYGEIPERLLGYLDYAMMGRDLNYDGYVECWIDGRNYIGTA